jgi:hypothetical protein
MTEFRHKTKAQCWAEEPEFRVTHIWIQIFMSPLTTRASYFTSWRLFSHYELEECYKQPDFIVIIQGDE